MEIVIVDDSPSIIAVLTKLVGGLARCRANPFLSAHQALAWCEAHDPDMVLVDYMMPEMGGLEFTRRFRLMSGKAETPVLMVTAESDRALRHRALTLGINDFLNKPFDHIELKARVSNMLALRTSQKISRAAHCCSLTKWRKPRGRSPHASAKRCSAWGALQNTAIPRRTNTSYACRATRIWWASGWD